MYIPLILMLIITMCSQFWSLNPSNTIKRSLFFLASTMGGIYIGFQFRRQRIVLLFEVMSVIFVLLISTIVFKSSLEGVMTFDTPGAWRGLFNYKSFAGVMVAFASIVFLFRLTNF